MVHAHRGLRTLNACEWVCGDTSTALDACQLNHLENERRCIIGILSLPPTTTHPNWLLILHRALVWSIGWWKNCVHLFSFPSDAFTPYDVLFVATWKCWWVCEFMVDVIAKVFGARWIMSGLGSGLFLPCSRWRTCDLQTIKKYESCRFLLPCA